MKLANIFKKKSFSLVGGVASERRKKKERGERVPTALSE